MKRLLLLFVIPFIVAGCQKPVTQKGVIFGTVLSKTTNEPIKAAGIELRPLGLNTVTGSNGQFQYDDIEPGDYALRIAKSGYVEQKDKIVSVSAGQISHVDIQLEKRPPTLLILDDTTNEIDKIVFTINKDDTIRSFNIFNNMENKIEWSVIFSSSWIKTINKQSGTLYPEEVQVIVLNFDYDKLQKGDNSTTIHVVAENQAISKSIQIDIKK